MTQLDQDYLRRRAHAELEAANRAAGREAREAHRILAQAYLDRLTPSPRPLQAQP